jgi:quercetin dioxygenase-like cupin family protein
MTTSGDADGHEWPSAPGDTLLFENERVRVWRMTLEPGGMFDFHQHRHDHVVIWLDGGVSQGQELGDQDWGLVQDAGPGFVLYKTVGTAAPMRPHRIRNDGDRATAHVIVELLEPSPSREEEPWVHNGHGALRRTS